MATINELIQQLTPFSDQKYVREAIAMLNDLSISITDIKIDNCVQHLNELLVHDNGSLSNIALDGVMTLARLKPGASSSSAAPNLEICAEATTRIKSLLHTGLVAYSEAPAVLSELQRFYAKDTPNRSSFFGLSVTEREAPSVVRQSYSQEISMG